MKKKDLILLVDIYSAYESLTLKLLFDIIQGSDSRLREELYEKSKKIIEIITKEDFEETYATKLWISKSHAGDLLITTLQDEKISADEKINKIKSIFNLIKDNRNV